MCGSTYPDWNPVRCINHKGGVFDPERSKTWKKSTVAGIQGGSDTVAFSNITLQSFPLKLDNDTSIEPADHATLGLGLHSDLLEHLVKNGTIGSRTWALDQGLTGDPSIKLDDWVDGQLTLGGYDESRYSGEMFALKMNDGPGCPLRVTVDQFILNLADGTSVDLGKRNPYLSVVSPIP